MSARGDFTNVINASESGDTMDLDSEEDKSESTEPKEDRDDLINPFWIEDRDLGRGEVDHLSGVEIQFWKDLIDKYLHPIDADKQREVHTSIFQFTSWVLTLFEPYQKSLPTFFYCPKKFFTTTKPFQNNHTNNYMKSFKIHFYIL